MRIEIAVIQGRMRARHDRLARRLRAAGHDTRLAFIERNEPAPRGVDLLMMFEDLVYGPLSQDFLAPIGFDGQGFEGAADVVIDFTDDASAARECPTLFPLFDTRVGDGAAMSALLDGRSPAIAIALRSADAAIVERARGLAAIEHPHRFKDSFNRVVARVNDLIVIAVRRIDMEMTMSALESRPVESHVDFLKPLTFGFSSLAGRVERRLQQLSQGGEAWRVAWRRFNDDAVRQTFAWPRADYAILRDDGARYYADPFAFANGGQTWVFVEEFPYATNKGVISVFTISPDGVASAPRPVLETPYHLSYPFVFERDGVVYMLPESCAANRLELYRAERFPDVWVRETVLIDNIVAADATLLETDGKLWLFATVGEDGQSDWDSLRLFHADTITGAWTPHEKNPVLIDASQARAAGRVFERDGRLYRPTQDCSIDRLDERDYSQNIAARLIARPGQGFHGVHTLNDAGGVEVIDLLGSRNPRTIPLGGFVNHAKS